MVFGSTGERHLVSNSRVQAWDGISLALMLEKCSLVECEQEKKARFHVQARHQCSQEVGFCRCLIMHEWELACTGTDALCPRMGA